MTTPLRDVLHDLAPEPPAGTDLAAAARGRAGAIRRRRYAATAFVLVACLALGAAALPRGRTPVRPAHPATGSFPYWAPRGELAGTDNHRIVDAYTAWVYQRRTTQDTRVVAGTARVLYAGGGGSPVWVLYAVVTTGGERVAIVVADGHAPTGLTVYADVPAPAADAGWVAVLLDPSLPRAYTAEDPCGTDPLRDPASRARLLFLGAPNTTDATWAVAADPLSACPGDEGKRGARHPIALHDAAALVDVPLGPRALVDLDVDGAFTAQGLLVGGPEIRNGAFGFAGDREGVLGWRRRTDESSAEALGDLFFRRPELRVGEHTCAPEVYRSLPDGTPTAFCLAGPAAQRTAFLVAVDAQRRERVYRAAFEGTAFAAIVAGYHGRWLVVVGPETLDGVRLVYGRESFPVPMTHGAGMLLLRADPPAGAHLATPAGDVPIGARDGEVLERVR